ncbi:hypothetical protein CSB11_02525 [Candidatus Campbellbacteria bacterium]|nr:MAG: hypothetical protein CSB11_02525 [Candidatus Campbellbacteria bacterium]
MEQENNNHNSTVAKKKWPYVLSILIGVLLILLPQFASFVSMTLEMILGWFLTIVAFLQLAVLVFQKEKQITSYILPTALFVIGFYFLLNPASALAVMSLLFGTVFVLSGLSSLIQSFSEKGNIKKFLLFSSLLAFIFAVMIFINWPASGISFIGVLLGIQLIISGTTGLIDKR